MIFPRNSTCIMSKTLIHPKSDKMGRFEEQFTIPKKFFSGHIPCNCILATSFHMNVHEQRDTDLHRTCKTGPLIAFSSENKSCH